MGSITFRPDAETARAVAMLPADGRSASAAIREAVLSAARTKQAERSHAEAIVLVADAADVAEARAVLTDL